MKKLNFKVVALLLAGSLLSSSCIGSFSLFNKYAHWQRNMSGNKYLNAIVGFVLMPIVGTITLLVDSLVLNSVEFWSGNNPVTANIGKTKMVTGEDGRLYAVKTLKDGYEITAPDGQITLFTYNAETNGWSVSKDGVSTEIFRFSDDGKSIVVDDNGKKHEFSLNEQGVKDAEQMATARFYAAR